MTPMCSTSTGQMVGWAAGMVDCDGNTVTIEYFNTLGISQGTSLPGGWTVCRPSYSSEHIATILKITQAAYDALVTKDPNTLYVIVG